MEQQNRKQSKKNKRAKGNPARRRGVSTLNEKPPQFNSNVFKKHKFRFLSTTNFSANINNLMIIGSTGSICTVANSLTTNYNKSFRIRKIELWAPPASQGSVATLSVEWIGGSVNSPNREVSDSSMSTAFPAHLRAIPPVGSLASFWNAPVSGTAVNMFTLICPTNTVIDLTLDLVENDQETTNVTNSVVTGTLGNIYYLDLDGPALHFVQAVSLNRTQ